LAPALFCHPEATAALLKDLDADDAEIFRCVGTDVTHRTKVTLVESRFFRDASLASE
jgi:hypothetical protein